MTQSVRKPRRWPWILGVFVALFAGVFAGTGIMFFGQYGRFHIPCPPFYEPMPGEVVFRRGPDVLVPRPLNRPRDRSIPLAGRLARVNATVQILFRVEQDGRVSRIALGRSSGFCPYDVDALGKAASIRFLPGQYQGEAAAGWVSIPFVYQGGAKPQRIAPKDTSKRQSMET